MSCDLEGCEKETDIHSPVAPALSASYCSMECLREAYDKHRECPDCNEFVRKDRKFDDQKHHAEDCYLVKDPNKVMAE